MKYQELVIRGDYEDLCKIDYEHLKKVTGFKFTNENGMAMIAYTIDDNFDDIENISEETWMEYVDRVDRYLMTNDLNLYCIAN